MSQPHHDSFRPKGKPAKDLSTPHLRALRKELLIVRSDVERAEILESYLHMRDTVTHFRWLKALVPGFGRSRSGAAAGSLGSTLGVLLKQYPLLGSLVSLVLTKPLRHGVAASAKPLLKWGGLGFAGWEAFRVWARVRQQLQRERQPVATRGAGTGSDT